jgi:hypothetical protein
MPVPTPPRTAHDSVAALLIHQRLDCLAVMVDGLWWCECGRGGGAEGRAGSERRRPAQSDSQHAQKRAVARSLPAPAGGSTGARGRCQQATRCLPISTARFCAPPLHPLLTQHRPHPTPARPNLQMMTAQPRTP